MAERIDTYEVIPHGMKQFLSYYGRHFSKPLYEMAVEMMETRDGNKVKPMEKQAVMDKLKIYNTAVENDKGYDVPYVWAMGTADYLGSSIPDEPHLAKFVHDYVDDPDGSPTRAFDEFYAKTLALDIPIAWEDVM